MMNKGADPNALDGNGKTPWDAASNNDALIGTDILWRLNDERFR